MKRIAISSSIVIPTDDRIKSGIQNTKKLEDIILSPQQKTVKNDLEQIFDYLCGDNNKMFADQFFSLTLKSGLDYVQAIADFDNASEKKEDEKEYYIDKGHFAEVFTNLGWQSKNIQIKRMKHIDCFRELRKIFLNNATLQGHTYILSSINFNKILMSINDNKQQNQNGINKENANNLFQKYQINDQIELCQFVEIMIQCGFEHESEEKLTQKQKRDEMFGIFKNEGYITHTDLEALSFIYQFDLDLDSDEVKEKYDDNDFKEVLEGVEYDYKPIPKPYTKEDEFAVRELYERYKQNRNVLSWEEYSLICYNYKLSRKEFYIRCSNQTDSTLKEFREIMYSLQFSSSKKELIQFGMDENLLLKVKYESWKQEVDDQKRLESLIGNEKVKNKEEAIKAFLREEIDGFIDFETYRIIMRENYDLL